ncbi:MAG TPA: tRNA dihydrouridine synthase DusB [Thermodesulfobacteriota bacterium]|nr:tRNA dihydrouridine synthase DusB [Thermodesulfobacteriota bacterium]
MLIGTLQLYSNLFLAPMAGYTDLAFRLMAKRHGAGMVFTEMISANGLLHANRITSQFLSSVPEEQPLSAQLFGADPDSMARAASMVADQGVAAVDINMGCPVRKVIKTGAGAALMQDLRRAEKMLVAIRKMVSLPVTVKMRSGWDSLSINCREMARIAEDCGINAVIVHPRTARQLFTGSADWNLIREVKQCVSIPVIGSGDVSTCEDALRMEAETGCDGVMIGRAALGNPWIFQQVMDSRTGSLFLPEPPAAMRLNTVLAHLDLVEELYGGKMGLNRFKAQMIHYLKGIPKIKALRRDICAEVKSVDELRERVKRFFAEAMTE